MGNLLKMKPTTIEEAKARLEKHISEAHLRYNRAVAEIEEAAARRGAGEPTLPSRAQTVLKGAIGSYDGEVNRFGRPVWSPKPITPEAVSKLTAAEILNEPNCGYKTLRDIVAWLEFHGLKLKE